MKKFNIDIAWDENCESFGSTLEELAKMVPSALVRVNVYKGSGGGWPDVTIVVDDADVWALFEWYGHDDFDGFIETFALN